MKIVIFGGAGFIGTNVGLLALRRGHSVIAFDNLERPGVKENLKELQKHKRLQFIKGDIRLPVDFKKLPSKIDCFINFAAQTSLPKSIAIPLADFATNVIGHLNILEYSRHYGKIPVILASSNKVYTDKLNTLSMREVKTRYTYTNPKLRYGLNEFADIDGVEGFTNTPYGAAKIAAEKYTREYWKHYDIPIVINRMSCIYGTHQKGVEEQGWLDWFLRAKKGGLPITIFGNGKQVRDTLFGSDVAELYLYEAEHMNKVNGKTFNVGGGAKKGFNTSLLEALALIDKEFPGPRIRLKYKPWRASDQRIYISDIRFVTKVTGWNPKTPLLDGLRAMWKAYE